jgi:hypothetical protein
MGRALAAYPVNTAEVISKGFETYMKGITHAICDAIDNRIEKL